ncbi:MAG TPA: serine hydrolase [Armatimonadota bacterium]|nr:serine hydrolase [Armatimonadota bacterium]
MRLTHTICRGRRAMVEAAALFLVVAGASVAAAGSAFTWQTASPESQGMDGAKLDTLRDALAQRRTRALVVIRNDRIVYEWYAPGHGPDRHWHTASLAKQLLGGMSLLVALNDGRIRVDDPAWKYIPAWEADPVKSQITIRHLATHSSGIEDANSPGKSHHQLEGWKRDFWSATADPFSVALNQAPVVFPPGAGYAYSNPGMAALAYAVTASLRGAPQSDLRALLKQRIMDPIGVPPSDWRIGYEGPSQLDGMKLYANWGGATCTARAVARVARLMLRRGDWQGRQLLTPAWVEEMVSYAGTPLPPRSADNPQPAAGLCWYTNFDGVWASLPRDAFAGAGAGHQLLLVVPSLDLIVVRMGESLEGNDEEFWGGSERHVFDPLMRAIADRSPYPPSDIIRSVSFAPVSAIVRHAVGSDNWPITWGDDDRQYAGYGDGWGFAPGTDRKLSLGFAKIAGSADDFRGANVRSASGEREGEGERGPKASGMLMVDGVLYMWVRNVGNSQLAWSADHGRTWQWGFRFDTSFGCPTFLNFGRNYAGARDDYVYTYSPDGPSAYESYDRLVLARVRKERLRDRSAYELFASLDASGRPIWTRDITRRGAVFEYPGRCARTDAVYHPEIKRYLLALAFDRDGGWGIFDAPEPWGPWTTAYHAANWNLRGVHSYRLPSKWIDGSTLHLVFSGHEHDGVDYDAFCVRRLRLDLRSPVPSARHDSRTPARARDQQGP